MIRQRYSAIEKGSGCRSIQRTEQLQQGRFTASTRSSNGNELALFNGKIDSAQCLDLPFVELAGESLCLEKRGVAGNGSLSASSEGNVYPIPERALVVGLTDRSNCLPLRPDARIGEAAYQFN